MTTTTHTAKTLNARRAHGEALIQQADAEQAQRLAAADAEQAQQEVARRQAQARYAELSAQLDQIDAFSKEQERRADERAYADVVRRQETLESLRAFANEKPAMGQGERERFMQQLDREAAGREQAERDRDVAYIDRCESQRLWDRPFAARWAASHPGGLDGCTCPAHRAYRGRGD